MVATMIIPATIPPTNRPINFPLSSSPVDASVTEASKGTIAGWYAGLAVPGDDTGTEMVVGVVGAATGLFAPVKVKHSGNSSALMSQKLSVVIVTLGITCVSVAAGAKAADSPQEYRTSPSVLAMFSKS